MSRRRARRIILHAEQGVPHDYVDGASTNTGRGTSRNRWSHLLSLLEGVATRLNSNGTRDSVEAAPHAEALAAVPQNTNFQSW